MTRTARKRKAAPKRKPAAKRKPVAARKPPAARGKAGGRKPSPRARSVPQLSLDATYMMAESIGAEAGLTPSALRHEIEAASDARADLLAGRGPGVDRLGWIDLPDYWRSPEGRMELERVQGIARRTRRLGSRHLVLGIGGSSLPARAVLDVALPFGGAIPARRGMPQFFFAGHNLDADQLGALMDHLAAGARDTRDPRHFTVEVVSKSGGTLETAAAFRVVRDAMKRIYRNDYVKRIVAITDPVRGSLRRQAEADGFETLAVPPDIAGRYSALTPVGLFPAALAGVDLEALLDGAAAMARHCLTAKGPDNMALTYAALMHLSVEAGRPLTYLYCWSDALAGLGRWHDQLVAESLGKDERGRVPVSAVVPGDLHTRGQEVQDGARNAVVVHLRVEHGGREIKLPRDSDSDGLGYLAGRPLADLLRAAYEGTALAYAVDERPGVALRIPCLDAAALGELFYFFEMATAVEGYLGGINPFDQPGVEGYKAFMYSLLGRSDEKGIERKLRILGREPV